MSKFAARSRRILLWLTGIAVIAVALYVALRPRPVLVDIATIDTGPLEVAIEEDGTTRIRERYVVSAPLDGRLLRIVFDVGDSVVAEKTVVARVEPTDPTLLDPREVAQAQARVRAAERKLALAEAELKKAEAALQFAEVEMGRARKLSQTGATSDVELAEKQLAYRQNFEDARAAGFAVDIAQYELELQQAALILTDPEQGDEPMELAIEAPITGRILRIYQESTAVISAGNPLLEIGDPNDLEVVADVLSRDAVRIEAGDPVVMEHWGREQPLHGRVRLVEPSGFTKVSALGVEEQRVNVIIDLVDPPEQRKALGDNFRVDCRVIVWSAERTRRVPTSALFRVGDRWSVFAVVGGRAQQVPVKIGQNNGRYAELIEGLQPRDVVIVHPSETVADGVRVSPRSPLPGAT